MRHALVLAVGLALASPACSHGEGDPALPAIPVARIAAPEPVAAAQTYRVPVEGLPSAGDPRALVTVVAFTDYQCPYCKRAEATIGQLRQAYGSQLRLVVAEAPLPMHERARPAAVAALAAAEQGAYEAMRARLYAGPLDDAAITRVASELGLDVRRFQADLDHAASDALARSRALADRLGVHGTPTFFINGRRVVGAQPFEELKAVVDERLGAARALVASGARPEEVYARTIAGGAERVAEPSEDHAPGCQGEGACDGKDDAPTVGDAVVQVRTEGAMARGPSRAPITIVEFADFECPFCARAEATLHAVEQAHPGDVQIVWKNLPLPFHSAARPMARAALAAGAQGRFWEMHDRLFTLSGPLDRAALDRAAAELGLDVARFHQDLEDPSLDARIDADGADAKALGVTGTPTFFVNGRRVVGAQPQSAFEQAAARR